MRPLRSTCDVYTEKLGSAGLSNRYADLVNCNYIAVSFPPQLHTEMQHHRRAATRLLHGRERKLTIIIIKIIYLSIH